MITRDYLHKFGFTPGCSKCEAIRTGDNRNPTLAHSAGCRSRIEGLIGQDPFLKRKLENANHRQDEYLAKRVEAGDSSAKRGRASGSRSEEVILEPAPQTPSESRVVEGEDLDGEPLGDGDMGEGGAREQEAR